MGVEHHFERADGPALRPDGPRSRRSAHVGRTVRACAGAAEVAGGGLDLVPGRDPVGEERS